MHGLDYPRLFRVKFDPFAQLADVLVERAAAGYVIVAPAFIEKRVAVDHLARAVMASVEDNEPLRHLYELEDSFEDKVRKVARNMYGARDVIFTIEAQKDYKAIAGAGLGDLPICIAKTPASLSDDPTVLGRPEDFDITARNVQVSAGAEFLVVLTGNILRMPGLPRSPQAYKVKLNADGTVDGVA